MVIFQALIISQAISVILALTLVYLFSKSYRLQRSVFLLGLPLGFFFLAISYVFLALSIANRGVMAADSFMWLRLVTQTFGFVFISATYYFSSKPQKTTRFAFLAILTATTTIILILFALLFIAPPIGLPSVSVINDFFGVANLVFVGYIIAFLIRKLELAGAGVSGLVSAPLAFTILWIAQLTILIWSIDGSLASLITANIARIVALTLFLRIYYLTSKGNFAR
jgi:hypothetical protein